MKITRLDLYLQREATPDEAETFLAWEAVSKAYVEQHGTRARKMRQFPDRPEGWGAVRFYPIGGEKTEGTIGFNEVYSHDADIPIGVPGATAATKKAIHYLLRKYDRPGEFSYYYVVARIADPKGETIFRTIAPRTEIFHRHLGH